MRLPRWLLIAMLTTSVFVVIVTAGGWWVTWPDRTIREFRSLINEGKFEQANSMIDEVDDSVSAEVAISGRFWRKHPHEELLFPEPPSSLQRVTARRVCKLATSRIVVVVERSRISARTEEGGVCRVRVLGD
jgi:hypothetical protein